jgi:hypothetical protein
LDSAGFGIDINNIANRAKQKQNARKKVLELVYLISMCIPAIRIGKSNGDFEPVHEKTRVQNNNPPQA